VNGAQLGKASAVLVEVLQERKRQHARWGEQDLPDGTSGDPEAAAAQRDLVRARVDRLIETGRATYRDITEEEVLEVFAETDEVRLRAELIQAMAVMGQWVEAIDRRSR